jgi:hypothetical protein
MFLVVRGMTLSSHHCQRESAFAIWPRRFDTLTRYG